jgi:polysaccharide export outer membrane protein
VNSDYQIGPGDLLRIAVFDHPELSIDARVTQSGKITFPLLGQVSVAGGSTRDVEQQLAKALTVGAYIHNAQVAVLVAEYQSQLVSVMGEVLKPGPYALQKSYRVLDVLAQAGGVVIAQMVGDPGAADYATLLRQDGTKQRIDLETLFEGDPSQNVPVQAGDTIYVPRAPQFYVYGEVQRPGVYRLEPGMTVSQAISAGGGLTPKGSLHWLSIKRVDSNKRENKISVHGGDLVQPNDVVWVKEGWL